MIPRRLSMVTVAALAAAAVIATAGGLIGCGRNERQTTVVTTSDAAGGGLTALEKGRLRGQILRHVRKGIAAWRAGDTAAMRAYFSKGLVDYNAKLKAQYARKGMVRVRKHTGVFADVVELSASGKQASAQYTFANGSYFADARTGRPLSKPSGKHGEIDFTVERKGSQWVIVRMFSSKGELE